LATGLAPAYHADGCPSFVSFTIREPPDDGRAEVPPDPPRGKQDGQRELAGYRLSSKLLEDKLGALWSGRAADGGEVWLRSVSTRPPVTQKAAATLEEAARWAVGDQHERVLSLREVVSEGSDLFLVNEGADGAVLGRLLEAGVGMPEGVALRIARDVLEALAHLHDRDGLDRTEPRYGGVCPLSIVVRADGRAQLIEPGVAAVAGGTIPWSGELGRAAYRPPESLKLTAILDARSDLFSLGSILWEMIAGRRLFDGDNRMAVQQAVRRGSIARVDQQAPASDATANLVARALERDPDARFESVNAMLEAIDATGAVADPSEVVAILASRDGGAPERASAPEPPIAREPPIAAERPSAPERAAPPERPSAPEPAVASPDEPPERPSQEGMRALPERAKTLPKPRDSSPRALPARPRPPSKSNPDDDTAAPAPPKRALPKRRPKPPPRPAAPGAGDDDFDVPIDESIPPPPNPAAAEAPPADLAPLAKAEATAPEASKLPQIEEVPLAKAEPDAADGAPKEAAAPAPKDAPAKPDAKAARGDEPAKAARADEPAKAARAAEPAKAARAAEPAKAARTDEPAKKASDKPSRPPAAKKRKSDRPPRKEKEPRKEGPLAASSVPPPAAPRRNVITVAAVMGIALIFVLFWAFGGDDEGSDASPTTTAPTPPRAPEPVSPPPEPETAPAQSSEPEEEPEAPVSAEPEEEPKPAPVAGPAPRPVVRPPIRPRPPPRPTPQPKSGFTPTDI
jgi:serine/threonine-protein kinase